MITLPDDKCLTVRGFGAACQILTWPLLYANALDACVPAEGIRFPGSFILAEERGHGIAGEINKLWPKNLGKM